MNILKTRSHAVALLLVVALAGCSTGQPQPAYIRRSMVEPDPSGNTIYMQPVEAATRKVISKNYELGMRRVASVGEPVVGVRNYTAHDIVVEAIALEDYRQICYWPRGLQPVDELSFSADAQVGAPPVDAVDVAAEVEAPPVDAYSATPAPRAIEDHPVDVYSSGAVPVAAPTGAAPEQEGNRSLVSRFKRLLTGSDSGADASAAAPAGDADAMPAYQEPAGEVPAADMSEEGFRLTGDADAAGYEASVEADSAEGAAGAPIASNQSAGIALYDESAAAARRQAVKPAFAGLSAEEMEKLYCRRGRLGHLVFARGDRFTVVGQFTEAAKVYYLVRVPIPGGDLLLAVDDAGNLKPERYLAWHAANDKRMTNLGVPLEYQDLKFPLQFDSSLFRFEHRESVEPGGVSENFDLVYEGTSYDHRGMVYHMRYREFDRARTTRPIYVQDLAYIGRSGTVDVLGMRIRVHDVSDKQIIYTVQND